MSPLEIESINPEKEIKEVITDFKVTVSFSAACNKEKTESAFSLNKNGNTVEGGFSWNDSLNVLTFTPFNSFSSNAVYALSIDTKAEDEYGNSLKEDFGHEFSMRTDGKKPRVVSCSPELYQITDDPRQAVVIEFSKAIDPKSWLQSFSISPFVNGVHSWNQGNTIFTFTPAEDLEKQEVYQISIDSSCSDLFGISIGKSYTSEFSTTTDKTPPELVTITDKETQTKEITFSETGLGLTATSDWECNEGILLCFSEPVKTETILSYIDFDPPASFEVEEDSAEYLQNVALINTSRLSWNQVYRITVKGGFEDASANYAETDSIGFLKTDGNKTKPPVFYFKDGIAFLSDPDGSTQTDIEILTPDSVFPISNYPISSEEITFFDFKLEFGNAQGVDAESEAIIQCFLESVSISSSNGSVGFSVLGAQLSPPSGITAEGFTDSIESVFELNENQRVIRLYVELTNNIEAGIISIELDNEFHDNNDNPVEDSYSVQYVKN